MPKIIIRAIIHLFLQYSLTKGLKTTTSGEVLRELLSAYRLKNKCYLAIQITDIIYKKNVILETQKK